MTMSPILLVNKQQAWKLPWLFFFPPSAPILALSGSLLHAFSHTLSLFSSFALRLFLYCFRPMYPRHIELDRANCEKKKMNLTAQQHATYSSNSKSNLNRACFFFSFCSDKEVYSLPRPIESKHNVDATYRRKLFRLFKPDNMIGLEMRLQWTFN